VSKLVQAAVILLAVQYVSCSTHRPAVTETGGAQFLSEMCEAVSTPEPAVAALLEAETFRDTHVGYAGVIPPEVCAFVTILRQADAPQRFERLLESGHLAGQLYALCGLYLTSQASFEAALGRFVPEDPELWTQFGCIIMKYPVTDLLDQIRSGELPERFDSLAKSMSIGGTQSNNRLKLTVRPVTARACARSAPGRPAA
jgi:hypothetical protein